MNPPASPVPDQLPHATRSSQRRTLWSTAVVVMLVNVVLASLADTSVLGDGVLRGLAAASLFLTFAAAAVLAVPARTRQLSQGVFRGGVLVFVLALLGPFFLMSLLEGFGQ